MSDHSPDGFPGHEFESLTTDDEFRKNVTHQFIAMNIRLSNQDTVIETTATAVRQIAEDTKAMRDAWNDGVAVKRFFCRMADAWTFILHKVFLPVVLPITIIWSLFRLANHEALPDFVTAGIKLLNVVF